jgi:hypothetical protein
MFDMLKLGIAIAIGFGLIMAVPIFGAVFGMGLAVLVLHLSIKEYKQEEDRIKRETENE